MTKASVIETEILEATGAAARKPKEALQVYLQRLMKAVAAAPETVWDGLSEDKAQAWYNSGVSAVEKSKPIPNFPDAEAEAADDKKGATKAAAKGAKAPVKEKAASGVAKAKEKGAPRAPVKGAEYHTIAYAIKHPKATAEDIMAVLVKQNLKAQPSTVNLQLKRTRRVLAIQAELAG